MYNITKIAATQTSNKLAVSGFILQWANSTDLKQFLTNFRPEMSSSTTFTLQTLDGGFNAQTRSRAGIEADSPTTSLSQATSADVASYLTALGTTNGGKFNTTGRGFPDVAAQGENFEIAWDAQVLNILHGESSNSESRSCLHSSSLSTEPAAAAPLAIIALLNDELVATGKSPLGFLNPFLYSAAGRAALSDITSGTNPGCSTNGFPAKAGWIL
ncbi:hypothetical protein B0H10DRAFT_2435668 [Mycena sp. CBHHK59/15]|nr:hypothetical protein B0H10DRAFT_2435668 [Mycena sp. CBHHK59/15]